MKIERIIPAKSVSGITELNFPQDNPTKFVDIALVGIIDRVPCVNVDSYLWGSSDPVMASVDGSGKLIAIEIQAFPSGPCDVDLRAYIDVKNPEIVDVNLSDEGDSPWPYVFKGDKKGMYLRFSNFSNDTTLYQVRRGVFLGFDPHGTLSEFILIQ